MQNGSLQKLKEILNNFPFQNDAKINDKIISEFEKTNLTTLLTAVMNVNKQIADVENENLF